MQIYMLSTVISIISLDREDVKLCIEHSLVPLCLILPHLPFFFFQREEGQKVNTRINKSQKSLSFAWRER